MRTGQTAHPGWRPGVRGGTVLAARLLFSFSLLFLSLSSSLDVARGEDVVWETVAPGIDYHLFTLPGPNNVHVARMDRLDPQVTIESSIGLGKIASGLETVRGMAARYDQALNNWPTDPQAPGQPAWGSRNRVVVAINGAYIDPQTWIAAQGQIHSGWYAKRFDTCATGSGGSGFAWKFDRSAFIGKGVSHIADRQFIEFTPEVRLRIDGINIPRLNNRLVVYTPQYDRTTNTQNNEYAVEVLVELDQPFLIAPTPHAISGWVLGRRDGLGSTLIPFDHIVLSAHGSARDALLKNIAEYGDQLFFSQEVNGCPGIPLQDWTKAYASIGGAFYFLENGEINAFSNDKGATDRHPRTAIALDDHYIYFIVVDGRDAGISIGMTIAELATFSRDVLGAGYGIAQDGGGSSTMVINGRVVNKANVNNLKRYCFHAFAPLVSRQDNLGIGGPADPPPPPPPLEYFCERPVPNGLMMVVVEPMEVTETFKTGDWVITTVNANLRLGPGTNYPVLVPIGFGEEGQILDHANGLNGVLAKGFNWWKVSFGGDRVGWMAEQLLLRVSDPDLAVAPSLSPH
jgi:hypothetical protein